MSRILKHEVQGDLGAKENGEEEGRERKEKREGRNGEGD